MTVIMMLAPFNTDHVSLKSSRSLSVATLAMFKAVANRVYHVTLASS